MKGPTARAAATGPSVLSLGGEHVVVVGAGFIGTAVALAARDLGRRTTVLTRSGAIDPALAASGCRVVVGDAADPAGVRALVRRPCHVVYCAGGRLPTDSVDDPAGDALDTLTAVLCVLEAMRTHPGSRITVLSSGGTVYGRPEAEPVDEDHPCRPIVPYGVSRLAVEGYAAVYAGLHGVQARILRLGNVYGPGQPAGRRQGIVAALLAAVLDDAAVEIWGDGRVARDYVHVRDVADVVHRLPARLDGLEVLNVGTGVARTVLDVVEVVEQVTGAPLRLVMRPGRSYDVERIALSTGRLAARIPYRPMTLEQGIEATWARLPELARSSAAQRT